MFVNGSGFLNNWKCESGPSICNLGIPLIPLPGPEVPGLHDFKGQLMHSANWDPCELISCFFL